MPFCGRNTEGQALPKEWVPGTSHAPTPPHCCCRHRYCRRWQPAPRVTEADRSGDRRTLHRRLDQRIFMLVRPAGKADAPYTFPSAQHQVCVVGAGARLSARDELVLNR